MRERGSCRKRACLSPRTVQRLPSLESGSSHSHPLTRERHAKQHAKYLPMTEVNTCFCLSLYNTRFVHLVPQVILTYIKAFINTLKTNDFIVKLKKTRNIVLKIIQDSFYLKHFFLLYIKEMLFYQAYAAAEGTNHTYLITSTRTRTCVLLRHSYQIV